MNLINLSFYLFLKIPTIQVSNPISMPSIAIGNNTIARVSHRPLLEFKNY